MNGLQQKLDLVSSMSGAELRAEWERVHSAPTPRISADLLRLGLAYQIQEKTLGALSRKAIAELRNLAAGKPDQPAMKPGTRLVRTWNGRTISVVCQSEGFVFEDRQYRSLSAIAREITGTAWSGPRFFGLTGATANA